MADDVVQLTGDPVPFLGNGPRLALLQDDSTLLERMGLAADERPE